MCGRPLCLPYLPYLPYFLTYLTYLTYLPYLLTLHDQFPKHCTKQVPLREEKPSSVTQLLESRYAYAYLLYLPYILTLHTYLTRPIFRTISKAGSLKRTETIIRHPLDEIRDSSPSPVRRDPRFVDRRSSLVTRDAWVAIVARRSSFVGCCSSLVARWSLLVGCCSWFVSGCSWLLPLARHSKRSADY